MYRRLYAGIYIYSLYILYDCDLTGKGRVNSNLASIIYELLYFFLPSLYPRCNPMYLTDYMCRVNMYKPYIYYV